MERQRDDGPSSAEEAGDAEELETLLQLRDAEIVRLETCLANERRAALATRVELDQLRAAHEGLLAAQKQAAWTSRLKRLFRWRKS